MKKVIVLAISVFAIVLIYVYKDPFAIFLTDTTNKKNKRNKIPPTKPNIKLFYHKRNKTTVHRIING